MCVFGGFSFVFFVGGILCVSVSCFIKKTFFIMFNMYLQNKLLKHTPVNGTHSSYELGCGSRTLG